MAGRLYAIAALSVIWLVAWVALYRRPEEDRRVSAQELALIRGDPCQSAERVSWPRLFGVRETGAYAIPKFLTDPIWWMFLFWLSDFPGKRYGLDLKTFGLPMVVIYLMSDAGSVMGGWASSGLIRCDWNADAARKATILICALVVVPVVIVQHVDRLWLAMAIIELATAAHRAFSTNLMMFPSDLFPRSAVASVVGIVGTAGAMGGMMIAKFVGYALDATGNYASIFAVVVGMYLLALAAIHIVGLRPQPARSASPEISA